MAEEVHIVHFKKVNYLKLQERVLQLAKPQKLKGETVVEVHIVLSKEVRTRIKLRQVLPEKNRFSRHVSAIKDLQHVKANQALISRQMPDKVEAADNIQVRRAEVQRLDIQHVAKLLQEVLTMLLNHQPELNLIEPQPGLQETLILQQDHVVLMDQNPFPERNPEVQVEDHLVMENPPEVQEEDHSVVEADPLDQVLGVQVQEVVVVLQAVNVNNHYIKYR